jgi:protein-disulfide isomerase
MNPTNSGLSETLNKHLTTGLLVAAAFVIGMLVTEVRYLKKAPAQAADTNAQAAAPQPTPPPFQEWTADQLKEVDPVSEADHVRGNQNAKLTLIEYSDFECPYCKRFIPILGEIEQAYPDQVRVIFRHYPLPFHAFAQKAAEASECAAKQGGNDVFWKFHDLYYERTTANGTGFPQEKLADLAAEAGAKNKAAFQQCLDSDEMAQKVKDQMESGTKVGIQGTPGTIVVTSDGKGGFVSGALPFAMLKPYLDKLL